MHNLDIVEPIDVKTPVQSLGGNTKLYFAMLSRLEKMSLSSCLSQITEARNRQDWQAMKAAAHSLKGASGYVGAGKVHYACYYIQKAYNNNDFEGMMNYYPLAVEACLEYKRFARQYLA